MRRLTCALACCLAALVGLPSLGKANSFELISRTAIPAPTSPDAAPVGMPDASADGRYVVFASPATNLLEGGSIGTQDIFLVDAQTATAELISVDSNEAPANGDCHNPLVSGDGRYVLFFSVATNLDATRAGGTGLYLRDRSAGTTRRVDLDAGGNPLFASVGAFSRDGRYLALVHPGDSQVYRKDLQPIDGSGALEDVSFINDSPTVRVGYSDTPSTYSVDQGLAISDDGSVVAWVSPVDVPAYGGIGASGDNDGALDIFIRDMSSLDPDAMVVLASRAPDGSNPPDPVCVSSVSYACDYPLQATSVAFHLNTRWMSGNGQRVAFNTYGALLPADTPRSGSIQVDAYLFDRSSGPSGLEMLSDETGMQASSRDYQAPVVTALSTDGGRALINFRNPAVTSLGDYLGQMVVKPIGGGPLLPAAFGADGAPVCCAANSGTLSGDGSFAVYDTYVHATADDLNADYNDLFRSAVDSASQTLLTRPAGGANVRAAADNRSTAHYARVSTDGRYVLFASSANNLVAGDDDGRIEFFLLDRVSDTMQRVGTARPPNSSDECRVVADMTPDARYVVYSDCRDEAGLGWGAGTFAVYRWDRVTDARILVSRGDGVDGAFPENSSYEAAISSDGNLVAFASYADNLDATAPAVNANRVFLRNIAAGTTRRISRREDGSEPSLDVSKPAISADGRYIAFNTADPLQIADVDGSSDIYRVDTQDDSLVRLSLRSDGGEISTSAYLKSLAADGRSAMFVVEECSGPCVYPFYVRDVAAGTTARADLRSNGAPLADYVEFGDRSADGRYAAFAALAVDFIAGEGNSNLQVYVRDLQLGVSARVTVKDDGDRAIGGAYAARLSPDGRWIVFQYFGTDLVADPGNGPREDVFLTENPLFGGEVVADVDTITPGATEPSLESRVSGEGRYVVFESLDPALHAACAGIPNPPRLCGPAGDACPATGPLYVYRLDTEQGCVDLVSVNEDESPVKMWGRAKGGTDPVRGKPSISANGLLATFVADAVITGKLLGESPEQRAKRQKQGGNIVVLRNLIAGTSQRIGFAAGSGDGARPRISASGNAVVYTAPANADRQVFRTEVKPTGFETRCVSCKQVASNGADTNIDTDGAAQNPVVSANGVWVAYETAAKNLLTSAPACDNGVGNSVVVLRNMISGLAQVMSVPRGVSCQPGSATKPEMDYSGGKIVFQSTQPLTPGASAREETYFIDLGGAALTQVSVDTLGAQVDEPSSEPTISGDGRSIAFTSRAREYALSDTTGETQVRHVVVRDLRRNLIRRLSRNLNGIAANGDSRRPSLSYTGEHISFDSKASNLSAADSNGATDDVFLRINPLTNELIFGSGFD